MNVGKPGMSSQRLSGRSYGRPLAFWLGTAVTLAGVALQLPMFYMARGNHYHLAGMPVGKPMLVGMGLMFAGLGVTTYGLFPGRPAGDRARVSVSIAPLDEAPLRPAHIGLLLVLGIAITIDGMKPAAFAFLASGAAAEYGLRSPLNPGAHALSIALYPLSGITGTMLGSIIWGWLGDRAGRRASILLAALIFIATSTCGTMPEYWMNLVTCFIMGLGVGGMLPIAFTLLCETVPRRHRGWMMVLIGSNIAGSYIVVSWLASTWASAAHFGWRLLWLVGLPTGLLLLTLNRWIPESPRFLLQHGRVDEASVVLARYGAALVPCAESGAPDAGRESPAGSGRMLVSRPFLGLSTALILLALSIGTTQYGFQQWIPSNLQRLGFSSATASAILRNAAITGFPFSVPVALLYARWSSKKTILAVSALVAASLAAFALLDRHLAGSRALLYVLLVVPVWGVSISTAVLGAYAAEVYPTSIRGRGSGLSAGATKTGGVLILALVVVAVSAPPIPVTVVIGVIPMVAAILALARYGPETRHRRLEQITAEELVQSPPA